MVATDIFLAVHITAAIVYMLMAMPKVWYDIELGEVYDNNLAYVAQGLFALIPVYNLWCVLTDEYPKLFKVEEYEEIE